MPINDFIAQTTERLATAQLGHENEKDDTGFNNADYPLGFCLLTREDHRGMAQLLVKYKRQAGLDNHPELAAQVMAVAGIQPGDDYLAHRRQELRGKLCWQDVGTLVRFAGTALQQPIKNALRAVSERAVGGMWEVPKKRLDELLPALLPLRNLIVDYDPLFRMHNRIAADKTVVICNARHGAVYLTALGPRAEELNPIFPWKTEDLLKLKALFDQHDLHFVGAEPLKQKIDEYLAKHHPTEQQPIIMSGSITALPPWTATVQFTHPFSTVGEAVRAKIRDMRGSWTGEHWVMPAAAVVVLREAMLAEQKPFQLADQLSATLAQLAHQISAEVTALRSPGSRLWVKEPSPGTFMVGARARIDAFAQHARQAGLKWTPEALGWRGNRARLEAFLQLAAAATTYDASDVVAHMKAKVEKKPVPEMTFRL